MTIKLDKRSSGKTNTTYRGERLARLFFNSDEPLSMDEVKAHVSRFSKQYKEKGIKGQFCVSCLFPFGWRSGDVFDIGDKVQIYDPNQWYSGDDIDFDEKCSRFAVYVLGATKPEGGCNKYNDCLFQCIRQAFGGEDKMPKALNKPWKLKSLLGLDRTDKVPLDKLPVVEDALKQCSLTVYGDYHYISSKKAPLNIKLKLNNEHFTVVNNDNRTKTPHARFHPVAKGKIYAYQVKPTHKLFNGTEEDSCAKEISKMLKSHDYIMLPADGSLEETRNKFITFAEDILFLTNDQINLFRYPTTAIASMDTFRYMSKMLKEPEPISPVESSIISKAFMGGLLHADKGYQGYGITYDVNSMYPSVMVDKHLSFPMSEGEPLTLTDKEFKECQDRRYFKYGIYRCNIHKSEDKNINKLFKFNNDNHYTHYDLLLALELGLHMELIQDRQFNFYCYERSKLAASHTIFSKYIDFFYKLKQQYKPAKELLNCLWGALCQKEHLELYIKDDFDFSIDADAEIVSLKPGKDGATRITYRKQESVYRTEYARIGPFLTAYARLKLVRNIKPYAADIARIHTDSFTLTKPTPVSVKVGTEMGQFKVEYEGDINIVHVNKVVKG